MTITRSHLAQLEYKLQDSAPNLDDTANEESCSVQTPSCIQVKVQGLEGESIGLSSQDLIEGIKSRTVHVFGSKLDGTRDSAES